MNLFIFVVYNIIDKRMTKRIYHFAIVIAIFLLLLAGILILCGVLVDFGYIYQNELVIACMFPANIGFYLLASLYNEVTPKFRLWFRVMIIITVLAVLEYFFFGDATKHLIRAFALAANCLLIANFSLYNKTIIQALYGKNDNISESN